MSPVQRVIWVVDDSHLDAERARRVLSQEHTVRVFSDGSAVLEALSGDDRPDVLVLDWVMPGISGVEVCRFLRGGIARTQGMAILLLTAHRHTEQIVEGLEAGANDYLAKPYADEELRARVGSLLRSLQLVERAERAEAANRRLLENTPDPLIVVDADSKVCFANEMAALAFDSSAASLLGRTLEQLFPGSKLQLPRDPSDSMAPQRDVEIRGRLFSPSLRFMSEEEDGRTSILLRDVTERRLLDERKLDFYSMIAHDLRTPLNAITLRVHLMQKDPQIAASPGLSRGVHQIDHNLRSLITMIDEFLELASLDANTHRIERREVDMSAVLDHAVEQLMPLIEAKSHRFSRRSPRVSDMLVMGDEKRLHQVLTNLIANAIKFTPSGGDISASLDISGRDLQISIRDDGPGIEPELATRLFQRYQRADANVSGSGLGLMIVREIVEAHGGTVGVESSPGAGARFWLRLPRSGEPVHAA